MFMLMNCVSVNLCHILWTANIFAVPIQKLFSIQNGARWVGAVLGNIFLVAESSWWFTKLLITSDQSVLTDPHSIRRDHYKLANPKTRIMRAWARTYLRIFICGLFYGCAETFFAFESRKIQILSVSLKQTIDKPDADEMSEIIRISNKCTSSFSIDCWRTIPNNLMHCTGRLGVVG